MNATPQKRSRVGPWGCGCFGGILLLLVGVLALAVVVIAVVGTWAWNEVDASNVNEYTFETPLEIPPLLEPETDEDGRKVFDLTFQEGETELLPGTTSQTWGLNQSYLAPTIRAERGDEVLMNVTNEVDETTTLHWHGMHLPARMDGGPHQMIEPGGTWSPTWTVDQPAASLWFHPHIHGQTAEHVYRGAAGMFIVDDPEIDDLALPDEYGVDDIPLIVQDKNFHGDGSLDFRPRMLSNLGVLGDEILVNGTHAPVFDAETSLVRFRILNASNARIYNFGFEDERTFSVIASDSGLLESPVSMSEVQLSPGERAEIVVEVRPGDDVMLRSFPPDLSADFFTERLDGGDDEFDILRLRAENEIQNSEPLPDELVKIEPMKESDADTTRHFELNGESRINGKRMDMNRIDEVVPVGSTEIWEISNNSGSSHNFHIHLVHFQVLDIGGEAPPEHLRGWKDTVFIPRGETARVIAEFKGYTDPEVPYMYHCHILQHEDNGMMGQFVVVEEGTEVPREINTVDDHAGH